MIDLHCHILPGVDDGAKSMEESIQMAELAVKEGITHILATPHHQKRDWMNEKHDVIKKVQALQSELDAREIDLTLFPGQEVTMYGELLEDIKEDKILFIDEHQQYVLIEWPSTSIPSYTERLFYDLQSSGITPIIVHPERNHQILEQPNRLKPFVDKGAMAQLTAASYTGGFGKKIEKLSRQLIEANLVHFIASDAHNVTNRPFYMKEASALLEKEFGKAHWDSYKQTTKNLVNGAPVFPPTAQSISTSFISKWFN